eukprot:scaffold2.g6862.t1
MGLMCSNGSRRFSRPPKRPPSRALFYAQRLGLALLLCFNVVTLLSSRLRHEKYQLSQEEEARLIGIPDEWTRDAQAGTKYLEFRVCQEFPEQVEAFMDGAAIAYLLNLTMVLPPWYLDYDPRAPEGLIDPSTAQFDPQIGSAVRMEEFWDVDALIRGMRGLMTTALPGYLGPGAGPVLPLASVNPNKPSTFTKYARRLGQARVLRLPCTLNSVLWNNQALDVPPASMPAVGFGGGAEGATAPRNPRPYAALDLRLGEDWSLFCEPYLTEDTGFGDIGQRCNMTAAQVAAAVGVMKLAKRYDMLVVVSSNFTPADAQARAPVAPRFGACPPLCAAAAGFVELGFHAVVSSGLARSPARCRRLLPATPARAVPAAVDLQLLLAADLFVGNVFSTLSGAASHIASCCVSRCVSRCVSSQGSTARTVSAGLHYAALAAPRALHRPTDRAASCALGAPPARFRAWRAGAARRDGVGRATDGGLPRRAVRLTKLARRDPVANLSDAVYYNTPRAVTAGDVDALETRLFGVMPGILHPSLYAAQQQQARGRTAGDPPLRERRCAFALHRRACLRSWWPGPGWYAFLAQRHAEGLCLNKAMSRRMCTGVADKVSIYVDDHNIFNVTANIHTVTPAANTSHFEVQAALTYADPFTLLACTTAASGKRQCCKPKRLAPKLPYTTAVRPAATPVVYVHIHPGCENTASVGEVYRFHQEINRWHATGEILVRSVLPGGMPKFNSSYSNFTGAMKQYVVSPLDYLLVPAHCKLEKRWTVVAQSAGALPLTYFSGSAPVKVKVGAVSAGFKRICSPGTAVHYDCRGTAVMRGDAPMHGGGPEGGDGAAKEEIVLVSATLAMHLDVNRLQLPPNGSAIALLGQPPDAVTELYRRAKVCHVTRARREAKGTRVVAACADADVLITTSTCGLAPETDAILHGVVPLVSLVPGAPCPAPADYAAFPTFALFDYARINALLAGAMGERYAAAAAALAPARALARAALPHQLSAHVWRYFQEVVSSNPFYMEFDYASVFLELEESGVTFDLTFSAVSGEYEAFGAMAAYLQPPAARHWRAYVLLLPPGGVPLHPDMAAALFRHARGSGADVVLGPEGVVLARRAAYYTALERALPLIDAAFTLRDLAATLTSTGLDVARLEALDVPEPGPGGGAPGGGAAPAPRRAACQALFLPAAAHARADPCVCAGLLQGTAGSLWAKMVQLRVPVHDEAIADIERSRALCLAAAEAGGAL